MGRRPQYLAGAVVTLAAVAMTTPVATAGAKGFNKGVTAGEITSHSAIIWTRSNTTAKAKAKVRRGDRVVAKRTLKAKKKKNKTIRATIKGLKPNTQYTYRFCRGNHQKRKCSSQGRFLTAPKSSAGKTIRFAYSGDETGVSGPNSDKPFWGNFKAFKSMAAEHNDFNFDFGDTIYSDPEVPNAGGALSVKEKWAMYRKKLAVKNMRRIRESTGLYNQWDDHEFINNFTRHENTFSSEGNVYHVNPQKLYNHGVKAFRDYEPVTFSKKEGIYRTFRWGKNLQLFMLDQRSFRSATASANGVCDNPDTGQPDLAPTAPQSTRNLFSILIPSLTQPVSQQCKDKINNPNRTMLGQAQLDRFLHDVKTSKAKWKVVMNETPIQQFYADPYDRWEGYAHERVKLLKSLEQANVSHLVFLTTDTHAAFANIVRYRTLANDVAPANAPSTAPADTSYNDFIIGPVGTRPFWQEIDNTTGNPGNGQLLSNAFFKPPPPNGVGMECAQGGENSYAEVTVKSGSLKVAYKDQNGNTVVDSDGTTPCGPYVLTH